jgi:hypothetical protein
MPCSLRCQVKINEMEKQIKKRRTFANDNERVEATLVQNRKDQANKRKRDKGTIKLKTAKQYQIPQRKAYQLGFNSLSDKNFTDFLTLTTKSSVFFGWWVGKAKDFTNELLRLNIIGNFFKVFEYDGFEYHCHILIEVLKAKEFKTKVESWKYGTTKIVPIIDRYSKITHIEYCTKQLISDSKNNKYQQLIDAWDIHLTHEHKSIITEQVDHVIQPALSADTFGKWENVPTAQHCLVIAPLNDNISGDIALHSKEMNGLQNIAYYVCGVILQQINHWFRYLF